MSRIRRRRVIAERGDWPMTVEDELANGVDLDAYTGKLARYFARWAPEYLKPGPDHEPDRAVRDLAFARRLSDRHP